MTPNLLDKRKREPFKEGYINMNQTLAFGNHACTVREQIARAKIS